MSEIEKDQVEIRSFEVELRAVTPDGETQPVIEGMAAVYNKRSEVLWNFREQIEPGFFENVLKNDVRALWNHNPDLVLGRTRNKTLELIDDERGLNVRIHPADTQTGRDALVSIGRGDVNQMSFGFQVKQGGDEWRKESDGSILRVLKRGGCERLFDVSPVTFPAYPQTSVNVRSQAERFAAEGQEPGLEPGTRPEAMVEEAQARARVRNYKQRTLEIKKRR